MQFNCQAAVVDKFPSLVVWVVQMLSFADFCHYWMLIVGRWIAVKEREDKDMQWSGDGCSNVCVACAVTFSYHCAPCG